MPGPKVWPFIGTSWIFSFLGPYKKDDAVTSARDDLLLKHGPIYKEKFGETYLVNLHDPSDIEIVMKNQGKHPMRTPHEANVHLRKSRPDIYSTIGIMDTIGEDWYDIRMKVAPALLKAGQLSGHTDYFSQIADEFVACVEGMKGQDGVTDVKGILYRYALEAIWRSILGRRLGALEVTPAGEARTVIEESLRYINVYVHIFYTRQWWKLWKTPSYKKFAHTQQAMFNIINAYATNIKTPGERDANSTDAARTSHSTDEARTSLLQRYLKNPKFSKSDITIVIVEFVIAGTSTTSYFLSLLLHRLGQEQEIQNRIYKELKSLNVDNDSVITDDLLNKMTFLKAVLREGYRLTSIVPGIVRVLPQEIKVRDYTIPSFTPVMCYTRVSCLSEEYFASPRKFIPDRWYTDGLSTLDNKESSELQEQAKKNRFLIMPFGFGSRMCIGRKLVEREMLVLMAKIFMKYKIESEGDLKLVNSLIIEPKSRVNIKFIERV